MNFESYCSKEFLGKIYELSCFWILFDILGYTFRCWNGSDWYAYIHMLVLLWKRSIFQIFWKPHCVTKSLFYELETSNFCYLLIFWICWAVLSFSKIGHHWYQTFYKGPSFEFLVDWKIKKHQRGEPYKMSNVNVVQSCRNFVQLSKIKK